MLLKNNALDSDGPASWFSKEIALIVSNASEPSMTVLVADGSERGVMENEYVLAPVKVKARCRPPEVSGTPESCGWLGCLFPTESVY